MKRALKPTPCSRHCEPSKGPVSDGRKNSEELQRTVIKAINEQKTLSIQRETPTAKCTQRIKERWFMQPRPRDSTVWCKRNSQLHQAPQSSTTEFTHGSLFQLHFKLAFNDLQNKLKWAFTNFSHNLDISAVQSIHSSIQHKPRMGWGGGKHRIVYDLLLISRTPSPVHVSNPFLLLQSNNSLLLSFKSGKEFHLALRISSQTACVSF